VKRQQIQVKATPESESDDDAIESPTEAATLQKKASPSSAKHPSQRASSNFVPRPPLPPKFNAHARGIDAIPPITPLPIAFGPPSTETAMTIWAIWKSTNLQTINDQDVVVNEAKSELERLLKDLITKSWNATRFLEGGRRMDRQRSLRSLWADGRFTDFDPKTGPTFDFS